jgi:hypothetical protein
MGFRGEQQELHGLIASLTERVRQLEQIVSDQRAKNIRSNVELGLDSNTQLIGPIQSLLLLLSEGASGGFEVQSLGFGATPKFAVFEATQADTFTNIYVGGQWGGTVKNFRQVSVGVVDSGGAGFRLLRVPNL